MDAAAIEEKLREILAPRAEAEGIAAAWLFESAALGASVPATHIYVGVLYSKEPSKNFHAPLERDLEVFLNTPVFLLNLNLTHVELMVRVFRNGRLIIDRDRSRRVQFVVRSYNELWDLEPYLKLYRRIPA